jgi:hypothetical protein
VATSLLLKKKIHGANLNLVRIKEWLSWALCVCVCEREREREREREDIGITG